MDITCIALYIYNCEVKAYLAAVNIYTFLFLNINGCVYIILLCVCRDQTTCIFELFVLKPNFCVHCFFGHIYLNLQRLHYLSFYIFSSVLYLRSDFCNFLRLFTCLSLIYRQLRDRFLLKIQNVLFTFRTLFNHICFCYAMNAYHLYLCAVCLR